MENRKVVVDTNIFIEFLRAKDKTKTNLFKLPSNLEICISSVTLYELLMGATTEEKNAEIKILTDDLLILPFTSEVAVTASELYHQLRKANKMIEFRDIFIAATCIKNSIPIKTLNLKHFNRIRNW